jgi:iron(III) transport system permease protein
VLYRRLTGGQPYDAPLVNIYTLQGLIFAIACYTFPYVFTLVANGLDRVPSDLEDASSILGGRGATTLRRITIPLVLPAMLAGSLIAILQALVFGSGVPRCPRLSRRHDQDLEPVPVPTQTGPPRRLPAVAGHHGVAPQARADPRAQGYLVLGGKRRAPDHTARPLESGSHRAAALVLSLRDPAHRRS